MKLINGLEYEIKLSTPALQEHFSDPYNYTTAILDQFTHDYYKPFITKKDKIILDIGANVGLFALHITPFAKKIICVEPTPSHMELSKEILKNFPVSFEESALSNHTGETDFYWCGINTTMNSLQNRHDRSFKVKCITLSDLLDKHDLNKVNFAKIDIEGSEHTAITEETLKPVFDRIDKIFIEVHPPDSETQEKFKNIFEAVGYKVEKCFHDSLFCTK